MLGAVDEELGCVGKICMYCKMLGACKSKTCCQIHYLLPVPDVLETVSSAKSERIIDKHIQKDVIRQLKKKRGDMVVVD